MSLFILDLFGKALESGAVKPLLSYSLSMFGVPEDSVDLVMSVMENQSAVMQELKKVGKAIIHAAGPVS